MLPYLTSEDLSSFLREGGDSPEEGPYLRDGGISFRDSELGSLSIEFLATCMSLG